MSAKKYQRCTRCVMDTSMPDITFDENGVCNFCHQFDDEIKPRWHPGEAGKRALAAILTKVKREGQGKEYDCAIGLSGGVDSSYLVYKAKQWGLRVLAVHVDAGWNSELAVKNIENVCKYAGYDLHTIVIDWNTMRNLQLAFLRSGTANQDIPQDHMFFAGLYNYVVKYNIKYVFNGSNFATESILPGAIGYNAMDLVFIKDICKKHGNVSLKKVPTVGLIRRYFYYPYIKRLQIVKPLNYINYNKKNAIETLQQECGWQYYGGKHYESRFTKFFQAYYLPTFFGYDKRLAHYSSLIVSGEITRDEALAELAKPLYDVNELAEDKSFVAKKLRLSLDEFETILAQPKHDYREYRSNDVIIKSLIKLRDMFMHQR